MNRYEYYYFVISCLYLLLFPVLFFGQEAELSSFATGLTEPVGIYHYDTSKYYAVEKPGRILEVDDAGQVNLDPPFLDIRDRVSDNSGERGLLGMAFHPDFPDSPHVYVNYTDNAGNTSISRFSIDGNAGDFLLDPDSEVQLITLDQPFANHNGGCVRFGPDGYLYIGLGDGGNAGDPMNNAQDGQTFLGKILRIDVDQGDPYAIPADNPFVTEPEVLDEIWALGLRNPFRFSFDPVNGDLWIGDVGQSDWEEVDYQPASSDGGENYGWRCFEGNAPFDQSGPCEGPFTFPVYEYANENGSGCSVTGGRVYRGNDFPGLNGKYIFTDYCRGLIQFLDTAASGSIEAQSLLQGPVINLVSFAETHDGELFVTSIGEGVIYRIDNKCSGLNITPEVEDELCPGSHDGRISLSFSDPDDVQSVSWSNGAEDTPVIDSLSAGDFQVTVVDAAGCDTLLTIDVNRTIDGPPILPGSSIDSCAESVIIDIRNGVPDRATVDWFIDDLQIAAGSDGRIEITTSGLLRARYAAPCETDLSNAIDINLKPLPDSPEIAEDGDLLFLENESYDSIQWYFEGMSLAGETDDSLDIGGAGTYFVEVFNAAGCAVRSAGIEATSTVLPAGREQAFIVFPNPGMNSRDLRVDWLRDPGGGRFEVIGADGQIKYERDVASRRQIRISVSDWSSGWYIIRWVREGETGAWIPWLLAE